MKYFLFFAATLFCFTQRALALETTPERLIGHAWRFSKPKPIIIARHLYLLSEVTGLNTTISASFLNAVAKERLTRVGIEAIVERGSYSQKIQEAAESHHWWAQGDCGSFLAPHLFIAASIHGSGGLFELNARVVLLRSERSADQIMWKTEHDAELSLKELTASEVNEKMTLFVRKEMSDLAGNVKRLIKTSPREGVCAEQGFELTKLELLKPKPLETTEVETKEGETKEKSWHLGVAVGSPIIGNLELEGWRIGSLPLATSLSGMYYSSSSRGVLWTTSWIFARVRTEHAVGIAVAGFNYTFPETKQNFASDGSPLAPTIDLVDRLAAYVGPVYTFRWNALRIQAGVSTLVGNTGPGTVRWLLQGAYLPLSLF